MITDGDVEVALNRLRFGASKAAQAKATRIYMEEYRKTVKANVMQNYLDLPLTAQEREAYRSAEYSAHLDAMRAAIEEDETCRWQMIAAQAVIEAWRTSSANQRGELKVG
jgi:hypothetical protein